MCMSHEPCGCGCGGAPAGGTWWYCGPVSAGPGPGGGYGWGGGPAPMTVPHELAADGASSPEEAFIGGHRDAHLTLEYLVETGAAAPAVTVKVTSNGSTSSWNDTGIAAGYHVQEGFLTVKAGSKVTLEVTDALARLRWCEVICC